MTKPGQRDEAAIANAMLLGDLVVSAVAGAGTPLYAFRIGTEDAALYNSIEQAAWMFLLKFGYGIEPNGTGLIRLHK